MEKLSAMSALLLLLVTLTSTAPSVERVTTATTEPSSTNTTESSSTNTTETEWEDYIESLSTNTTLWEEWGPNDPGYPKEAEIDAVSCPDGKVLDGEECVDDFDFMFFEERSNDMDDFDFMFFEAPSNDMDDIDFMFFEAPVMMTTTESPSTNITESPSTNTTESPSTNTTESPSTNNTVSPTTNTSESRSINTRESPSTNTTGSPSTNTIESHFTNTTESPSTNTTESPSINTSNLTSISTNLTVREDWGTKDFAYPRETEMGLFITFTSAPTSVEPVTMATTESSSPTVVHKNEIELQLIEAWEPKNLDYILGSYDAEIIDGVACPNGNVLDGEKCVLNPMNCPNGQLRSLSNGKCEMIDLSHELDFELDIAPMRIPPTFTPIPTFNLVISFDEQCRCKSGYHFSVRRGKCIRCRRRRVGRRNRCGC